MRTTRGDRVDALAGVRPFGLRRARYRSAEKAHLQNVATAVAINFSRDSAWLKGEPLAASHTSRLAQLAASSEFATAVESSFGQPIIILAHFG